MEHIEQIEQWRSAVGGVSLLTANAYKSVYELSIDASAGFFDRETFSEPCVEFPIFEGCPFSGLSKSLIRGIEFIT